MFQIRRMIVDGRLISFLCRELCEKTPSIKNVLFLRTQSTGSWLDHIHLPSRVCVRRVLYTTNIEMRIETCHPETHIIENDDPTDLFNQYINENISFDLVCIDGFHEYDESLRDFSYCVRLLSPHGVLLSHDCAPTTAIVASPKFRHGFWCGETYHSFIRIAHDNPSFYSGIIDVDTGIGILMKGSAPSWLTKYVATNHNRGKQEEFFKIKSVRDRYLYFRLHGKAMINLRKYDNEWSLS